MFNNNIIGDSLEFDIVIEKDKASGQVYAFVPLLPGCYSYADTIEELLENMKEAISLHIETMKKSKERISNNSVVGMVKVTL